MSESPLKIVISPAIDAQRYAQLVEAAGDVPVKNCASTSEARLEIVDATGFFGKLTPELLAAAKRLQWVQSPTASLEHYLFPELIAHPCQLSNMRGLFSDVIADHVFGYLLMICRNLHIYLRQQHRHDWHPLGTRPQQDTLFNAVGTVSEIDRQHRILADCTLGVVGAGSIGSEICRRGKMHGMPVLAVDPYVSSIENVLDEVWNLDRLPELLSCSDFVVIAAPHTPETEKLFRRTQFEQMRSSAWLINIGRGVIVDVADLTTALEQGTIAGAALDVFEVEPLPDQHPLWDMDNVILTPHVAAASEHVPQRHLRILVENVRRHAHQHPPLNLVDKHKWF